MTAQLHVRFDRDAPDRTPVVLLHGFASSGDVDWPEEEWSSALHARGRSAIVVDLPGHGASDSGAPADTSAIVDRIAAAVAERVGERRIDVIAYSLGARLAWDLASHPAVRVRRLVLGGLSPVEPFAAVDVAGARRALDGGPSPEDPLTGMILGMIRMPGNRASALLEVVSALAAEPFNPAVRPPAQPVLLLGGADDPMAAGTDDLAGALPDARAERVPGDHLSALRSAELRAAALAFLAD